MDLQNHTNKPTQGGTNMTQKLYLTANDVSEYMGISIPTAYKIIKKLNDELKQQGYITISGKINRGYFERKAFGMNN